MGVQVGKVYGAWKVLEQVGTKNRYFCICLSCKTSTQYIKGSDLLSGKTRMCASCARTTPDSAKPPEYNTWSAMVQRCCNPNSKDYPHYGGRGITIYPLWRDSFESFLMMVGPRPQEGDTLDRIDPNGNYEPGNVRWLSRELQTRNQRSNINLSIEGETKTVAEWSTDSRCTVSKFVLYKRIKAGWLDKFGAYATVFTPSKGDPALVGSTHGHREEK